MKQLFTVILLLAIIGVLMPRSARTQAIVYDNKQMPAGLCRFTAANFDWIDDGSNTYQNRDTWVGASVSTRAVPLTMPNAFPGVPFVHDPNTTLTYYQVSCPLIRDNPYSMIGITGIAIDVNHATGASPAMSVECWEYACIAPDANNQIYCCKGAHAVQTGTTSRYYSIPIPLVTSCNGSTNFSVMGTGVTCTLDSGTDIYGVRYNERGANSNDW